MIGIRFSEKKLNRSMTTLVGAESTQFRIGLP
jgi:hypothetical protein